MKRTKKKKDLGIFYTPPEVVELIVDMMLILKDKEDQDIGRWQSNKPAHYPSIIDPACGEGIFLKKALVKKLATPDQVFGVDLDDAVVQEWERINLLEEFRGDKDRLKAHFFHQNGLIPLDLSQHKKYYSGKVRWQYLDNEQFDFVLGNPPYGGVGIADFDLPVNAGLDKALGKYEVWYKGNKQTQQASLMDVSDLIDTKSDPKIRKQLEKYPIEVLFIERFLQLAKLPSGRKAGGRLAIILPEGIFANSTLDYVRQFVSKRAKVLGIISLPRDTFKGTGTNAKTSILLLEKIAESDNSNTDYPIFLASLDKLSPENMSIIITKFKEFMYGK